MDSTVALSDHERTCLRGTLATFADRIERVSVFGSRVLGRARPASDIDVVLYGPITDTEVARLWTMFDDSSLAVRIDLIRYDSLGAGAMKRHIDAYSVPVFERSDLTSEGVR